MKLTLYVEYFLLSVSWYLAIVAAFS